MVAVDVYTLDGQPLWTEFAGAFKSFRRASEFIIGEGLEPFYDDVVSELSGEESISFVFIDKENNEEHTAAIECYAVHE